MTHEIDIQRVRGELKWDGIDQSKFGKLLVFPTKSAMRIADLADAVPQIKRRLTKEEINIITGTIAFAVVIVGLIVRLRIG